MVKVVEENSSVNPIDQNLTSGLGQGQDQTLGGLGGGLGGGTVTGNEHLNSFNLAFGMIGDNSVAGQFTSALTELAKTNSALNSFKWGTVRIAPEYGSVAWVAGRYNDSWLYGLLVFEAGSSVRLQTQNNKESYYTVTGLINNQVLEAVAKDLKDQGIEPAHYILTNTVPDFPQNAMTPQWANTLMGQMQMCIFGRIPGYLSSIVLNKNDRFTASIGAAFNDDAVDSNNHPNRADISLTLEHMFQNQTENAPTLLASSAVTSYPRVVSCGYTNLRVLGMPDQSNGENLKQCQGEVVVSLIDSNVQGSAAPIDRQLLALSAFARVAQSGGWRDSFLQSLSKDKRKLSALGQYLRWGQAGTPDKMGVLDTDKGMQEHFLRVFAPNSAALIVHHRAGNGVGGLSTMLAEIAVGNTYSLKSLIGVLNKMFPSLPGVNGPVNFGQRLVELTGKPIDISSVTATAVPTMDGVYVADGHRRTLQDMDTLSVLTQMGDNVKEGFEFLRSQSFASRNKEPMEQRIYLIKMADAMFRNNGLRLTGDSLDIAINPIFAKLLVDATNAMSVFNVVGLNVYDDQATTMFAAGGDALVIGQNQAASGLGAFSLGMQTSNFNLL